MKPGQALAAGATIAIVTAFGGPAMGADPFYAAPNGGTSLTCPIGDPCEIAWAVQNTPDGGELIVLPGVYGSPTPIPAQLEPTNDVRIHGLEDQPRPKIISDVNDEALLLDSGEPQVWHLEIEQRHDGQEALDVEQGTAERVVARASGVGGVACHVQDSRTIRDSVCWGSGLNSIGVFADIFNPPGETTFLRNLTAVGTGTGSRAIVARADDSADDHTIVASNVIARGESKDIDATAVPGADVQVVADHSNFATVAGAVTPTNTNGNQSAPPLWINPLFGDFRQAAGSPTIDNGADSALNGPLDFDAEARIQGPRTDIGADELTVPSPAGEGPKPPVGGLPQPGSAKPSNAFFVARPRSRRNGSVDLTLTVPGPGVATAVDGAPALAATRKVAAVRRVSRRSRRPGRLTLRLRPTKAAQKALTKRRSLRVRVRLTFTPTGGTAASRRLRVTLRRAKRR